MIQVTPKLKTEYGDFQTPLELAEKICHKLLELGVSPDMIVEPTCGIGNFIQAAAYSFPSASKIIGLEINQDYIQEIVNNHQLLNDERIQVQQGNFFEFDWSSLRDEFSGKILVLGNFPWVTNSQQGVISGNNLPQKTNFQNHKGLDAVTGKSNFDISEWMLIHSIQCLQKHEAYLAMLCKTSVARKILNYLYSQSLNLAYCATYKIDAKKYFNATVDACLLFCKFDSTSQNYFCNVFDSLNSDTYYRIGYRNNTQIRDVMSFDRLQDLHNPKMGLKWRSGIKHDCSSVMELCKVNDTFINGLGEVVDIEETYLFPLVKGSDIANNRTKSVKRYVLVTQSYIGEKTEEIRDLAPRTWKYLETHSKYLDNRKSKIYQNSFRFSIFGVGSYTFAPWKIAICGLYKKLDFRLVGKMDDKVIVFDDTVYFLSFDDERIASQTFALLTSAPAIEFYSSLIFWDEKRPIKSSILNSLNLSALAKRLSIKLQYFVK
ncbi:class I SAM-dependent methyltransferase [Halotia branconii]|uniref:Class I SAM-dependent methyltransferase n=1 Tax=Halotia branconii CENA392 TaxID=1539056 RepID=A0AAJ6NRQ1_9CYAN|nr:class I SAM-dependent methyltransferase [Halotia branconii]WGV25296.1 class I SAM-dependent methyltransferase [Halotia branconii CENA392]